MREHKREHKRERARLRTPQACVHRFGRFEEALARVAPHQSTILWNTEAVDTFRLGPQLPVLEAKVDWTASYEMHSDVPLLQGLPVWVQPEDFARASDWQRPRPGAIAWVASNCETTTNGRTELVRELMRFTRVDSFGKCLHNKDLPVGMEAQRSGRKFWADKVRLLENYTLTVDMLCLGLLGCLLPAAFFNTPSYSLHTTITKSPGSFP